MILYLETSRKTHPVSQREVAFEVVRVVSPQETSLQWHTSPSLPHPSNTGVLHFVLLLPLPRLPLLSAQPQFPALLPSGFSDRLQATLLCLVWLPMLGGPISDFM